MSIKFIGLKTDSQACLAMNILKELGQEVLILENESTIQPRDQNVFVGLFTSPNLKLFKHGNLSRTASHRIINLSPSWLDYCQLLIAIRPIFDKKSKLKDMCKEWIKIAESLSLGNLSKSAPWGTLPTAKSGFDLYRKWVSQRLCIDPDKLGLEKITPVNNITQHQIKLIRDSLKTKKDKRLTDRVIRLANRTHHNVNIETLIKTSLKLIEITREKRLLVESGQEFELIMNCIWRVTSGEKLMIIAPICPSWTRDENGYTFCGLEPNSRGIFYDKMAPELDYFITFLKSIDVDFQFLGWVADIEWFSFNEDSCNQLGKKQTKEEFMAIIEQQCHMIRTDLESRVGLNVEIKPLLKILPEAEYSTEAKLQGLTYEQLLKSSSVARRHFENTLKAKASLYQKQFGIPVSPSNPDHKIKNALIRDVVSHLAPLTMLTKLYRDSNLIFFLKSEPFNQLYKDFPYISWHASNIEIQ